MSFRVSEKIPWGVLARKDSRLAGKRSVKAADLLGVFAILARRDSVKNELADWFGEYFDRLEIEFYSAWILNSR